jgi:hypothetical protein
MKKKPATKNLVLTCPSGHAIPNRTPKGNCTPVYCAGKAEKKPQYDVEPKKKSADREFFKEIAIKGAQKVKENKAIVAAITKEAEARIDKMIPESMPEAREEAKKKAREEVVRLGHSVGRWAAMRSFFDAPEGLQGADAEQYVQRRAMMLSVDAVLEIERQLKYGDDSQRREAARDILDMVGMRKKEAVNAGGPVIMLVGGQGTPLPWLNRAPISSTQITDGNTHAQERRREVGGHEAEGATASTNDGRRLVSFASGPPAQGTEGS